MFKCIDDCIIGINMQIIAIVQARSGSKRFPNKIMKKINGKSIIELLLTRKYYTEELNFTNLEIKFFYLNIFIDLY